MSSDRPAVKGFQKPISQPDRTRVGLAVVTYGEGFATCSCGWAVVHQREKVREDRIDTHLNKSHNGRGIRL